MKPYNIAIVNSHPIQYFAPLYGYLQKTELFNLTVYYSSDISIRGGIDVGFNQNVKWDIDLLSGYNYKFIDKKYKTNEIGGFFSLKGFGIYKEILNNNFDAVWLHGYSFLTNINALIACKISRTPVIIRMETHNKLARNKYKLFIRNFVLKIMFKHINAFLSIGSANKMFYHSLGVPDHKIFTVPYTVDNDRFIYQADASRKIKPSLYKKYGVDSKLTTVLYASKFDVRKHPDALLEASIRLFEQGFEFNLVFVGAGSLEKKLIQRRNATVYKKHIKFLGFINQTELPNLYQLADVFVLPAENEPWGLVVNEIMCSSKPIIISRDVGCALDLVINEYNGYLLESCAPNEIASYLIKFLDNKNLSVKMGENGFNIIKRWNYSMCANGLINCMDYITNKAENTLLTDSR